MRPATKKPRRFKWYHLYYFLAVFDVLTILSSLYLNHAVLNIYTQSVDENAVWSSRVGNIARLSELAASVNAPGNDVFDSNNILNERNRLSKAYAIVQLELTLIRHDLADGEAAHPEIAELTRILDEVKISIDAINKSALSVFRELENNSPGEATVTMAMMDRHFSEALSKIGQLGDAVRNIQAARFDAESSRAQQLSRWEFTIAGIVGFILIAVTWYGSKMAKFMRTSEESLKSSERRIKAIFDTAAEPIMTVAIDGTIVSFNAATESLFGYSGIELTSQSMALLLPELYCSADNGCLGRFGLHHASDDEDLVSEVYATCKDGSSIPVSIAVSKVDIEGKKSSDSSFFIVIIHDLRKQKAADAKMLEAKAAETANRTKSTFLANMSHEIRTPLTGILGFADLLLRSAKNGDAATIREYSETIHTNARHLLCLINDILDLSKVESGEVQIELVNCSPHGIVNEVISVLRARAIEKGITLDLQWEGSIPSLIKTDPVRFKQLLMNVVGNAIKFTDEGGVAVTARYTADKDNDRLKIEVIDTGIGISPVNLQRIFNPFVQADNTVTRKYGGTGLGLAISREIALLLGGDLRVTSQLGKGSTFTIELIVGKVAENELHESSPADAIDARRMIVESPTLCFDQLSVLLVEDGPTNRKLFKVILEEAGAVVTTAENGQIGVHLASNHRFDVVLLDMQMPVMDGYTAASKLRELGLKIPIIALTAHAMKGDDAKCLAAGCSSFLTKPVTPERLLNTISDAMASSNRVEPDVSSHAMLGPALSESEVELGAILSTLPTHKPVFMEIVHEFADFFSEQIERVEQSVSQQDFETVAQIAHALKGAGGSAGFDQLTDPSVRLGRAAEDEQLSVIGDLILEMSQIRDGIELGIKSAQQTSIAKR
jgi:PAS domain S-box-containing protein